MAKQYLGQKLAVRRSRPFSLALSGEKDTWGWGTQAKRNSKRVLRVHKMTGDPCVLLSGYRS